MQLTLQLRGIAKSVAVFCAAFGFCICFKPKNLAALGAPPEESLTQQKLLQFKRYLGFSTEEVMEILPGRTFFVLLQTREQH